jgi:hypothetical protein
VAYDGELEGDVAGVNPRQLFQRPQYSAGRYVKVAIDVST